ncbi:hypothetical protein [Streptomyces axinellae]|uniref:Uncharacterized protein n=1 Tax=Streptomyces axinellae TaxID=552788 RepID=A0ABP6CEQ9_9ACTN
MTQTTQSTPKPPARGAYLADESAARVSPAGRAWVGRVQIPLRDGGALLVTHTGYQWPAAPGDLREATATERAAYDAARARWIRAAVPGVGP